MTRTTRTLAHEQEAFGEWLKQHATQDPTPKTLENKLNILRTLVNTYSLDMDTPNPKAVIEQIANRDISAATKTTYKIALRQYLEYRGVRLTKNLKQLLKKQRGQKRRKVQPSDLVTMDELRNIIKHTTSPMLRAYYACLWDTGARPSALTRMNIMDVTQDQHGYVFRLRKTKTEQSQREVRLFTPLAIQYFEVWWSMHPERDNPNAPVFINRLGNRSTIAALYNSLHDYHNERLGRGTSNGKASLSLYLFRKSRATQLLKEERLSPIQVKLRLGHKKHSQMLEQYYAILDKDDQNKAELAYLGVEEAEPRGPQTVQCTNCGATNDNTAQRCYRCKAPLSEDALLQEQRAQKDMIRSLIQEMRQELNEEPKEEAKEAPTKEQD